MYTHANTLTQMTAEDVLDLVHLFENSHIELIIDGGWAVDALLGKQTRLHSDLDIAMPHRFVPPARALLESRGYTDIPRDDTREYNFVLGDNLGHQVDFHTYTFDEQANLVFGLPYPPESLTGSGTISGFPVRCITPQWLVNFHTGYTLDEIDYQDVSALCHQFNLPLPPEFERFHPRPS